MSGHDNNDEHDDRQKPEKRDVWYKLRAIGGISTAIVAALIGVSGSIFLYTQQEASNKTQLYTQLMGEQERAENAVRKDMFTTILSSFLDKEGSSNSECVTDKINRQLLELEMISRNFHETMDLRPLFLHMVLNIVRDIPRNYNVKEIAQKTRDKLSPCEEKMLYRKLAENKTKEKLTEKEIEEAIDKLKNKNLDKLINIAKRITRKQLESLRDVEERIRFTIKLNRTCNGRPGDPLTVEKCEEKNENKYTKVYETKCKEICDEECEGEFKEECKEECKEGLVILNDNKTARTLTLNDNEVASKRSTRKFKIYSKRSYKKWKQVRIKVETNKLISEKKADPDGKDINTSEFWLSFFDFPLLDNTFLSSKERYAVILDDINETEAKGSLLYFPASYAGFKEKSYYQHRIMNTLLKHRNKSNYDFTMNDI